MNTQELREKSVDELQAQIICLLQDQFNLRMQKASSQLHQSHLLRQVRRDIACLKTILGEKIGN